MSLTKRIGDKKDKRQSRWFKAAVAAIVLYFATVIISQQVRLNHMEKDQVAADSRLETAKQENDALRKEKEELSDLEHIERIAREDLGMTKGGELPYAAVKR